MLLGLGTLPEIGEQGALLDVSDVSAQPVTVEGDIVNPVAHIHVEAKQPHLDRIFDYLIPADMDDKAQVGARVEVPLGSRMVSGFIISRDSQTYQGANLREIKRVVSPMPVLSPSLYSFLASVASEYGTGIGDLLPLAIPSRHARAEKEFNERLPAIALQSVPRQCNEELWQFYTGGSQFLEHVGARQEPHGICAALPGQAGSNELLACVIARARSAGQSAILICPTVRSATVLAKSLEKHLREPVALMIADASHQSRYDTFLRVLHQQIRIVVGTRNAVWAPAEDVGLVVVLDDQSSHMREVRSPYFHVRDVARMRAIHEKAAFLCFSPYVSEESAALIAEGEAQLLEASPHAVTQYVPRVSSSQQWRGAEGDTSRLPEPVFTLVREALEKGPVLFVVPHSGYMPVVACNTCREPAQCSLCGGALRIDDPASAPSCTRCATKFPEYRCRQCGGTQLRAIRIGSMRTAHEIARAFPGRPIVTSSASDPDGIRKTVDSKPRIVVSTPEAEPSAQGGFAAAVVLDARFLLGQGAGAEIQFLRTLSRIAVRVRPRGQGGHLMVVGETAPGLIAALNNWKLGDFASRLLSEREILHLPPSATWVHISGKSSDLLRFLALCKSSAYANLSSDSDTEAVAASDEADVLLRGGISQLSPDIDMIGPVAGHKDDEAGVYLRCARTWRSQLAQILATSRRQYSALAMGSPIRIEFDPEL